VRLVATLSLDVDGDLEQAMGGVGSSLRRVAHQRVRFEVSTTLLAAGAPEALHLMKRTGLQESIAPGVQDDAPAVVGALPFDLTVRLAGWLRGTHAAKILRLMRFRRALAVRVERLVRLHPIDADLEVGHKAGLHRLIKRTREDEIADLFALRTAELASPHRAGRDVDLTRLEALAAAIDEVRKEHALKERRTDLVIDGAGVMSCLGCEPGPNVGLALGHLTQCVERDPALNTRASLEAILSQWARENATRAEKNAR
jgi:tRNA nucleotidyltransferase/poly(A) polymerase